MRRAASTALTLFLAVAVVSGCDKKRPSQQGGDKPGTASWAEDWTPEKIAADPVGYLSYAGVRIDEQIEGREERLRTLGERKAEIDRKGEGIRRRVADAENVQERLTAAARRADDEDGWPVKFAGRTFDKAKAEAVLSATQVYLTDVKPLALAYEQATQRLGATESKLNGDIVRLKRMQEKINLDLERVRLNQGVAELTELRKTETELAAFSKTLADMSEDVSIDSLAAFGSQAEPADVETLLK